VRGHIFPTFVQEIGSAEFTLRSMNARQSAGIGVFEIHGVGWGMNAFEFGVLQCVSYINIYYTNGG